MYQRQSFDIIVQFIKLQIILCNKVQKTISSIGHLMKFQLLYHLNYNLLASIYKVILGVTLDKMWIKYFKYVDAVVYVYRQELVKLKCTIIFKKKNKNISIDAIVESLQQYKENVSQATSSTLDLMVSEKVNNYCSQIH